MKYKYVEYNPEWPGKAKREMDRIKRGWLGIRKIAHVGSTAVSGMGGKDIVDLAVVVDRRELEGFMSYLEGLGYEQGRRGGDPGKRWFFALKDAQREPVFHVHVMLDDEGEYAQMVGFVKVLDEDRNLLEEYKAVKLEAVRAANEVEGRYKKRDVYMKAKDRVVKRVLVKVGVE